MKYKRRRVSGRVIHDVKKTEPVAKRVRKVKFAAIFIVLFLVIKSDMGAALTGLSSELTSSGKWDAAIKYGESNIAVAVSSAEKLGMFLKGFCFGFLKGETPVDESEVKADSSDKTDISDDEVKPGTEPEVSSDGQTDPAAEDTVEASGVSYDSEPQPVSFTMIMPCTGNISSPFGQRVHPITGKVTMHNGVDIAAPSGSKIVCASDGVVARSEYNGGSGNFVLIDHGNGYTTSYSHMQNLMLTVGQHINAGQQVGVVGATGMTTGPHLHFELKLNGNAINPMDYVINI